MQYPQLLQEIKRAVLSLEPQAEILLYGSRARGDAESDSDWDLLILLDGPVTPERKSRLWRRLYDIELEVDEILCPIICSQEEWKQPLLALTPWHRNVCGEGLRL